MLQERAEEVVVLGVLLHQVQRTAGEVHHDFLAVEDPHLLPDQQVQEGADEHSGFVLGCLDVDDGAVDELGEFPEHLVGILVQLFEEDSAVVAEERVVFGVVVFLQEDVPLTHGLVAEGVEGGRVESELQTLSSKQCTLTILIYSSWMSCTEQQLLVDFTNSRDYLHWNSSSLEAMKRVVTPIACRTDLEMAVVLAR